MTVVAERTETSVPVEVTIDRNGGVTGLTVVVAVRDAQTANSWLDFNDDTFKTNGWTTRQASLAEVSAANAPGVYRLSSGLDISAITNLPVSTDNLVLEYDISGSVSGNLSEQLQLVNSFLDSSGDVWEELRASHTTVGTFGESSTLTSDGLATSAVDEIVDGVWDELIASHSGAGSAGLELQNKAEPGDAMDLIANAVDATSVATDAIDADALATDAVNEIRDSILSDSTPFAGANIDTTISSRSSHSAADAADAVWDESVSAHVTANTFGEYLGRRVAIRTTATAGSSSTEIRTGLTQADDFFNNMPVIVVNSAGIAARNINDYDQTNGAITVDALPFTPSIGDPVIILANTGSVPVDTSSIADAVWDEPIAAHSAAGSAGLELQNKAEPGDAMDLIASAVDAIWDEPIAGHLTAGSTGAKLNNADATADPSAVADAVWDEDIVAAHGTSDTAGLLLRALGAAISQRTNNPTLDSMLGVPDSAGVNLIDAVWNEPIAGHLTAGSTGEALNNAGGTSAVTPAQIADAVWDEPIAGHLTVGSTGAKLNDTAEPSDVKVFESEPSIRN